MKTILLPVKRLLLQIILLLLLFFLSRSIFTVLNLSSFNGLTIPEFLSLSFSALRFDLSAILSINAVYILLLMLPLPVWRIPTWNKLLQWFFVLTNSIAFAFEISDWAYYSFNLKRATIDVLYMISRPGDFLNHLPHFLVEFWYAPLGFITLVFFLYKANNWLCKKAPLTSDTVPSKKHWPRFSLQTLSLLLVAGFTVIGVRGGLQYIPIGNGNALKVTPNHAFTAIVLNTPFSIMHSYSGQMEELKLFADDELSEYFNPVKDYSGKPFQRKNVVYIVLEGFSKEFTGIGGRQSYTPFLDSLMQQSFVCTSGYANGLRSAEGIPAIISGVPALMEEPITTSSYGTNKLTSLPSLLREKGYETAFFHGGTNGTMSFDLYAANAGFTRYYGRDEYPNPADFDGHWGIWDEPYLQYFADELGKMQQPFVASVFTLSSHDPFRVPQQYQNTLPKGPHPVHQTIAYTDQALKKFFAKASQEPWFNNTLFVITADHCSPISDDEYYSSMNMGRYAIPIVFYAPGDPALKGGTTQIVQQIDILPTVLDYLGYDKQFFAFGNSALRDEEPRFVINANAGSYQWYMNGYLLTANELEPQALYNFSQDSLCQNNLLPLRHSAPAQDIIPHFQAFVQLYRSAIIRNKMFFDQTWSVK